MKPIAKTFPPPPSWSSLTEGERALLMRLRHQLTGVWVVALTEAERTTVADALLVRGLVRWKDAFLHITSAGVALVVAGTMRRVVG